VTLTLALEPYDTLIVGLRDGSQEATVSVRPSRAGATTLRRALQTAIDHGHGECFWPGDPGGQYWWMFKREAETLEVVLMWTRGGASLWEHVFRARDAASWVGERLDEELVKLML
jgi:hypothetical protein